VVEIEGDELVADFDDHSWDALPLGTGELDGPTDLGSGRECVKGELLQALVVMVAVGLSGRNRDGHRIAGLQAEDRPVEAGDDLTGTDRELERLAPLAAVELGAVGQGTSVVHTDGIAGLGCHWVPP
jgi:hypothetical protein